MANVIKVYRYGLQGPTGATGPQGIQGETGATGATGSAGPVCIFAGSGNPNGTQSATGPGIYLQTITSPPTVWFKVTAGTSNNEWH